MSALTEDDSKLTKAGNVFCAASIIIYFLACTILILAMMYPAHAGTRVWLMYGWGDNAFGSSRGVDEIAAKARLIPGVTFVHVYNWWQTQQIANEIMASPSSDKIVVGGYSCGANSSTVIAVGLNGHRKINTIADIQQSLWCGGYPLYGNVAYGQLTYAGCLITLGFGCKPLTAGQGFTGRIKMIRRPDLHPLADTDPDAQADVLGAIAATAGSAKAFRLVKGPAVQEVTRYHGQRGF